MHKYITFSLIFLIAALCASAVFSMELTVKVTTNIIGSQAEQPINMHTFTLHQPHDENEIGHVKCLCTGKECIINSVYIKQNHREKGLGKKLVRASMRYIIKHIGIKEFSLTICPFEYNAANTMMSIPEGTLDHAEKYLQLLHFYRGLGFEPDTLSPMFLTYTS